jgi:hypothetical protein
VAEYMLDTVAHPRARRVRRLLALWTIASGTPVDTRLGRTLDVLSEAGGTWRPQPRWKSQPKRMGLCLENLASAVVLFFNVPIPQFG